MIAILLFALSGIGSIPATRVDVIEVNHVYIEGKHVYDQVIAWEWSPDYRRHDVIKWWLVKNEIPRKRGDTWYFQNVKSPVFIETWGEDRERANKAVRPETTRRKL